MKLGILGTLSIGALLVGQVTLAETVKIGFSMEKLVYTGGKSKSRFTVQISGFLAGPKKNNY